MKRLLILAAPLLVLNATNASAANIESKCTVADGKVFATVSSNDGDISLVGKTVLKVFDDEQDLILKTSKHRDLVVEEDTSVVLFELDVDRDAESCELNLKKTEMASTNTPNVNVQVHYVEPAPQPVVVYHHHQQPRHRTVIVHQHRPAPDVVIYKHKRKHRSYKRVIVRDPQPRTRIRVTLPPIRVKL